MRWAALFGYGLSIVIHAGLTASLGRLPTEMKRRPTTVMVVNAKPKKEKPKEPDKEEKPPEPPKPVVVPKQVLVKPAAPEPPPEAPPPTPAPAGHEAMAALPDFGLSLGGSTGGTFAVAAGGGGPSSGARGGASAGAADRRSRAAPAPTSSSGEAPCFEPPTKPAYRDRVMPQYTDDARAAGVEGRVRVEVTLNVDGDVVGARVLEGLGHGLDQSALVAMKRAKFRPITRCGKPVASPAPFVVPLRFSLAD
jgi:protein TonB